MIYLLAISKSSCKRALVIKFEFESPESPKVTLTFEGHYQSCREIKDKLKGLKILTLRPIETQLFHVQNLEHLVLKFQTYGSQRITN